MMMSNCNDDVGDLTVIRLINYHMFYLYYILAFIILTVYIIALITITSAITICFNYKFIGKKHVSHKEYADEIEKRGNDLEIPQYDDDVV
jgi:hypothetical protein